MFTDDPQSSPTGKVFLQGGNSIAIVPPDSTVSFDRCQFRLVGEGLLPSGGPRVLYQDCSFSQRSAVQVAVRGTYTGTNSIVGNVIVRDPVVRGQLTVNGAIVP